MKGKAMAPGIWARPRFRAMELKEYTVKVSSRQASRKGK